MRTGKSLLAHARLPPRSNLKKSNTTPKFQTHLTNTLAVLQSGRFRVTSKVLQHLRCQCEAIETEDRCRLNLPMEASESRTIAILAEKPSVAQDIARVLGADARGKGYLQGNGYVVTWAIGHLAFPWLSLTRSTLNGGNGASINCRSCPLSGHWLSTRKPKISSAGSGAKKS